MKALAVLLSFSLVANSFLFAPFQTPVAKALGLEPASKPDSAITKVQTIHPQGPEALASLLLGDDSKALAQEFDRIGLPKERRRALLLAFVTVRLEARFNPQGAGDAQATPYWKTEKRKDDFDPSAYRDARVKELEALEISDKKGAREELQRKRYAWLDERKREALIGLEKDYAEMHSAALDKASGFWLKSDHEGMALLQRERKADIDAILTPDDKEQMAMRESYEAMKIRNNYGDVIASEEEFKQLFRLSRAREQALQNAPARQDEELQARQEQEANNAYAAGIRDILGDARLAQLDKDNDPDLELIKMASKRLGLGTEATPRLISLRSSAEVESQAIVSNTSLSAEDRKAAFTRLQERVKLDARAVLGEEGSEAYLERVYWMHQLTNNRSFSSSLSQGRDACF